VVFPQPANYLRPLAARKPVVIDVSNNNPISDADFRAANPMALVCKCTEADNFYDGTYTAHRAMAKKYKVPFGGYLFLHPLSAKNEAEWFLEHASVKVGDLQPWIDSEVRDGASFAQVAARVDSCAKVLEDKGLSPLLYSYTGFVQGLLEAVPDLKRLRVLQASYTALRHRVGHGSSVVGWQFTDRYKAGSGAYDASRLFVALDSLRVKSLT